MPALLEVRALTRRFGGVFANRDISFESAGGEIVGLIGPNGAGKTTLFNLVTGFFRRSLGGALRGTRHHRQAPGSALRRGIARTFQILRPFPRLTVEENVMVGPIARGGEHGRRAGRGRGIAWSWSDPAQGGRSRAWPFHRPAQAPRDGARMATEPRLLLLDEITGGVDQPSIPGLIALVGKLRDEGATLLVIEHNMRVIMELAEKLVFLHLGEKIAEGPPQEIARHPKVVELYLGKQHA